MERFELFDFTTLRAMGVSMLGGAPMGRSVCLRLEAQDTSSLLRACPLVGSVD
jgi:hypothetical protein